LSPPSSPAANFSIKRSESIVYFISVEYPASLLRGWKTSPVTVVK
jgi:hypothetical protein